MASRAMCAAPCNAGQVVQNSDGMLLAFRNQKCDLRLEHRLPWPSLCL